MAEESLIDFAVDSTAAVDAPTETPVVASSTEDSTVDTTTVTPAADTTDAAGTETETTNADGTEKTPEQVEEFKTKAAAKLESDKAIDTKATPENVRKALKTMRDADPKNAAVVKELHGAFERFNAYKTEFPTVQAAKEAKAFIETIGGPEGYEKLNASVEAIKATDELLYNADPTLWKNVIEDLKSSGHIEAFGQLAPSFLENLKEVDAPAYYAAFQPHFVAGLNECGFPKFLTNLTAALEEKDAVTGESKPNITALKTWVKQSSDWFKEQDDAEKARTKAPEDTPERKKFLAEKAEFEKTKAADNQTKVKQFEESVATEAEHYNNRTLGKALAPFLKMPFFKDFPRETMVDLGNGIKDRLYSTLKADKEYQRQMAAMWKGGNTPANKAKIVTYHNAKIDAIAQDIVTKTVQNRYPGYAKGGSAAGRVAAATEKKAADVKAGVQSVASGKPIYVAMRPTNLVREAIKVGDREYSASDLVTMQIMGRGFVKSTDGKSYRLITWRK